MSKATATMLGSTLTVKTGVNKSIKAGTRVRDCKTGTSVVFIGKVEDLSVKQHPFAFLDVDTQVLRRHSADYIAKYIG